jgi:NhaP-type Na+/H+ or K+/H+ antiporter
VLLGIKKTKKFSLGSVMLDAVMTGIFFLYLGIAILMSSIVNSEFLILIPWVFLAVPIGIFLSLPCVIVAWFYFDFLIQKNIWNRARWISGGALIAFAYVLIFALCLPNENIINSSAILIIFGLPIGAYVGSETHKKARKFKDQEEAQRWIWWGNSPYLL